MALLPGSWAIGWGIEADYPGTSTPITTDQRGVALNSPRPDIGAYQSDLAPAPPTMYTVNLLSDTDTSSGTDATTGYPSGDLLWAITQANANINPAGSVIGFDPSVFSSPQTITLSATLELSETGGPEVIDGPGAGLVTVNGGGNGSVFEVESGVTATSRA